MGLIEPHGGKLINNFKPELQSTAESLPRIVIDLETAMDVELIGLGAYSPLEGFTDLENTESILKHMALTNGLIWPLPIFCFVDDKLAENLIPQESYGLDFNGQIIGILELQGIFKIDKSFIASHMFGTQDLRHPGVNKLFNSPNNTLAGKIILTKRLEREYKTYELTPNETRKFFEINSWENIVAFHTRNVAHRGHEYIQVNGMEKANADGIFIHPVIGKKKSGDFSATVIIETYKSLINTVFKNKALFGTFPTYSRYAGPREAVFTALVRQNFGCNYFIVGRDHTGVGNFYDPYASQKIFDSLNLKINILKFDAIFYCKICNKHTSNDVCSHAEEFRSYISGTQIRESLIGLSFPPIEMMRPEMAQIVINKIVNGEEVFVK